MFRFSEVKPELLLPDREVFVW
uniref:Uncharacterized protein n=1 Tax=Rhizophora mucronata TaxID=61149 RepID=A0A2P2QI47_RHIMU